MLSMDLGQYGYLTACRISRERTFHCLETLSHKNSVNSLNLLTKFNFRSDVTH